MKRKTLKRKISIVGILVFVSMIVYSCWQDEWSSNVTDEVIFDSNKELTIAKAEQWYNATNSSATTVRSLSADGRIPAKPNWNKAKESRKMCIRDSIKTFEKRIGKYPHTPRFDS